MRSDLNSLASALAAKLLGMLRGQHPLHELGAEQRGGGVDGADERADGRPPRGCGAVILCAVRARRIKTSALIAHSWLHTAHS